MSRLSHAARRWLSTGESGGSAARVSVVDVPSGMAAGRRTGVSHYVADAAEISLGDETTLAVRWLCGGSTVDAGLVNDEPEPDCVNCRLTAAVPSRPVVYYAWDADGELLYVGSSVKVATRIKGHMSQTPWWGGVRRLTFTEYDTELEVRRAELAAIAERPGIHNREGRRPAKVRGILDGIEIGVEA